MESKVENLITSKMYRQVLFYSTQGRRLTLSSTFIKSAKKMYFYNYGIVKLST